MEGQQEKKSIESNIKTLLEKGCEVENIMNFLKEIEIFEKNYKHCGEQHDLSRLL